METTDRLNVIHARAAGVDVHKMQLTATVRLAQPGDQAQTFTRVFSALPSGITALVDWLLSHEVVAAAMEATGIYWETVYDALAGAGVKPMLLHAQHVKQIRGRKTDIADSIWLARICQFGLCTPSLVLPADFRELRQVSRLRRQIVGERSRARNRTHKILRQGRHPCQRCAFQPLRRQRAHDPQRSHRRRLASGDPGIAVISRPAAPRDTSRRLEPQSHPTAALPASGSPRGLRQG